MLLSVHLAPLNLFQCHRGQSSGTSRAVCQCAHIKYDLISLCSWKTILTSIQHLNFSPRLFNIKSMFVRMLWILPSYGTSSSHWPSETWTEPHGPSCRATTTKKKKQQQKFFFLFVTFIFVVGILTLCSMQSDFNNKDAGPQRLLVEKFHSYVWSFEATWCFVSLRFLNLRIMKV